MPPLSELPGEISQEKFWRALKRLGFEINTVGGKGSHIKATWSATQKCVIIPRDLKKQNLKYILEEIERYSGLTWDKIKNEL
jgi:predicted RNA binding protein YcfA (HicA-like mRNA interferase family)